MRAFVNTITVNKLLFTQLYLGVIFNSDIVQIVTFNTVIVDSFFNRVIVETVIGNKLLFTLLSLKVIVNTAIVDSF